MGITPLSVGEYDEAADFLARFGSEDVAFWLRRFSLWWEKNPAFEEGIDRGWLLWDEDVLKGFIANIPLYLQLMGKTTRVFTASTWRVVPECRNVSIELFMKFIKAGKDSVVFDTTPSREVMRMLEAFRFIPIPSSLDSCSIFVINATSVASAAAQRLLRTADGKMGGIIAGIIGKAAESRAASFALGAALGTYRLSRTLGRRRSRGRVGSLDRADARFDALWERTKTIYQATNVRTSDIVNWYCFGNKDFSKELLGYYHKDGSLGGYAVLGATPLGGMKALECLDLWSEAGSGAADALIEAAMERARQGAFDIAVFPHFSRETAVRCASRGLISTKVRRNYFYKSSAYDLSAINAGNSYFVSAQGDVGI
jgi:hypothetical protein